jgi:hypothetical protein
MAFVPILVTFIDRDFAGADQKIRRLPPCHPIAGPPFIRQTGVRAER